MKIKLLAASSLIAVALPLSAPALAADSAWEVSGNAGIYSDYRFRGFTETAYKPAFQGGIDFVHSSGFYLGNWNANVESGLCNGATLEMDFYAGHPGSAGGIEYDLGNGWGVAAAIGDQDPADGLADSYTDYALSVSRDISGGSLSAAAIGTSDKDLASTAADGKDGGKTGLVISLSRSF